MANINNGEIGCLTPTQSGMKSVDWYITADESLLKATDGTGRDIISYIPQ